MSIRIPHGSPDAQIEIWRAKGIGIEAKGAGPIGQQNKADLVQKPTRKTKPAPTLKNPVRTALRVEFELRLPILVVSEANRRDHWAVKNKRKRGQQEAIRIALLGCSLPTFMRVETGSVLFTRLSDGDKRLDGDNLANAFKAARDQVAEWLGIDDGDSRLTWIYDQDKSLSNGIVISVVLAMAMETLP